MDILAQNHIAMKKTISKLSLLGGIAVLFAAAMMLGSCEGPMGPAGLDGSDGADGADGINGQDGSDGTNGVAGNAVCLECHTTVVKEAVTTQWAASLHGTSQTFYPGSPTTVMYAGGRNDCAKCHSAEGFIETVWTGLDTTATGFELPTSIRCKACHDFHSSLDFENEPNSAVRETNPVTLMAGGDVVEFANAESNLCMACHQSRSNPGDDSDGTAMTEVYSHYGPHHGPQANFINGLGGYEFGAALSKTGTHLTGSDCISCHMTESTTVTEGGHTWVAGIEGCTACHSGATDFDINGAVTVIETKLHTLQTALITAEMLDADGHAIEGVSYQADSVGALWNYLFLEEDMSSGIHNPAYANALLDASIIALQ